MVKRLGKKEMLIAQTGGDPYKRSIVCIYLWMEFIKALEWCLSLHKAKFARCQID